MAKSKKEEWLQAIEAENGVLNVKKLAQILGVSRTRIYKDLEAGIFENATKCGRGLKSDWVFSKEATIEYIKSFRDTNKLEGLTAKGLTPPSKKLMFPGWNWEN